MSFVCCRMYCRPCTFDCRARGCSAGASGWGRRCSCSRRCSAAFRASCTRRRSSSATAANRRCSFGTCCCNRRSGVSCCRRCNVASRASFTRRSAAATNRRCLSAKFCCNRRRSAAVSCCRRCAAACRNRRCSAASSARCTRWRCSSGIWARARGLPGSVSARPGSTNNFAEVRLKVLRRIPSPTSNSTETRPSACTAVTCPSNHASSERQKTRAASPTLTVTSSPTWRCTDRPPSDASPKELTDQREGWPLSLSSSSSSSSSSTCGVLAKVLGICDASASCIEPGIEWRCAHGRR
mmetsp:Transcript_94567/g.305881  ORF Transcript_94567/g.305881 Transcript_94567/m.305881 type:complete len:296 (-) Transcript_94567:81-968(-)